MPRILATVVIPIISIGLAVYAIADIVRTDESRVRALPKIFWVLLVVIVPLVGAIVWIWVGKERETTAPSSFDRPARRPVAPDDDVRFLDQIDREIDREARIRELEERLNSTDDPTNTKGDQPPAEGTGTGTA